MEGHYWTDRDGFWGHGIYGFHQTFIPAFNSTTARLERPDWKRRQIKSQRSGNSQPISGNKTGSTFCWSSTIWLIFHEILHDGTASDAQHYELNRSRPVDMMKSRYFVTLNMMGTNFATLHNREYNCHQNSVHPRYHDRGQCHSCCGRKILMC